MLGGGPRSAAAADSPRGRQPDSAAAEGSTGGPQLSDQTCRRARAPPREAASHCPCACFRFLGRWRLRDAGDVRPAA